jgi:hypothetical protein
MIIFAKHDGCSKEFIFRVPSGCYDVRKGDVLFVETYQGNTIATATSEPVECRNEDDIAVKYGAYLPLKNVLCYANKEIIKYIKIGTRCEIWKYLMDKNKNDDILIQNNKTEIDALPF